MNDELINSTMEKLSAISAKSDIKGINQFENMPSSLEVEKIIRDLQALLFPSYFAAETKDPITLLADISSRLSRQIKLASDISGVSTDSATLADKYISLLPDIYEKLLKDIEALYEGDPAAKSKEMVLICYPGFYVISVYRLAHELYKLKVPMIPRMMTEYAHAKTGVDIHAGAEIGDYFFIDHGTGIVIGETTVIGNHVKLYQGVTLGAKSFKTDESGNPVKDIKRHPNIGNNVVIYANATILGGDTYIGDNSVIGGSVWLTSSVPENSVVYYNGNGCSSK